MATTIDLDLAEVYRKLKSAFVKLEFTTPLENFIPRLEEFHGGLFASAQSPSGEPWPELSQRTVQRKGHARILIDTEALRNSLAGRSGDSLRDVKERGLLFGTGDEKSVFHQFGTRRGLPQREHVGMSSELLEELTDNLADHAVLMLTES